jgi:hypothetical protein
MMKAAGGSRRLFFDLVLPLTSALLLTNCTVQQDIITGETKTDTSRIEGTTKGLH